MKSKVSVQKPPTKWCGLLSVRSITALMCALLIIFATAAALIITFHFSFTAADNIAKTHVVAITAKAKSDIEHFLNFPLSIIISKQFTFSRDPYPIPSEEISHNPLWYKQHLEKTVAAMRESHFKFTFVGIGFDDGNAVYCENAPNENFFCDTVNNINNRSISDKRNTSTQLTRTFNRSDYSLVSEVITNTTYDPRTRDWYKSLPRIPRAIVWSPVFMSIDPPTATVAVSGAIFNETGVMIGVISIFLGISFLDVFIDALITTENSVSILIDNKDIFLGSSFSVPYMTERSIPSTYNETIPYNCMRADAEDGTFTSVLVCRETVTSYPYRPLNELQSSHPEIIAYGTNGISQLMSLDGEDYFISVAPIVTSHAEGMNWRFILFLPANDIIGGIIQGRNISIYISIAIAIVAVIVNFLFVRLLLRPLNTVAEDMYRVASMQDMGDLSANIGDEKGTGPLTNKITTVPSLSILSEIATLQFAFNAMRTELAKIKSYLPQSVLAQLYGSDDLSDEGEICQDRLEDSAKRYIRSISEVGSSSSQRPKSGKYKREDASTVSSTHSGSHQSETLNTAMSLTHRRVTMLSLNIVGYHATLSTKDNCKISRIQTALVSAIFSACTENRGVMDGFQGDRFLASFNAVTNVGNHALQAVYVAHTSCKAAETMHTPLVVTAGVASGSALVGNMGCTTIKRFTILGHVVSTAATLERLAKRYRTDGGILAGGASVTDVENFFDVLTVDAAVLPISTASAGWRARIAAVMSPKSAASDEWMYELQEGSKKSRYGDANLAFAAFLEGDEAETSRILEQLFDGKHDPDSMSVGETLKKLITAEPAIDGKRYVSHMTDFYYQCVLPSGNPTTAKMYNALTSPHDTLSERDKCSSIINICFDSVGGCSAPLSRCNSVREASVVRNISNLDTNHDRGVLSWNSSVSEIYKFGESKA